MKIPDNVRATTALEDIQEERERQIRKGYDAESDDLRMMDDEMTCGAIMVATSSLPPDAACDPEHVPDWSYKIVDKYNGSKRRLLIIAAALIVAEIERLDRK